MNSPRQLILITGLLVVCAMVASAQVPPAPQDLTVGPNTLGAALLSWDTSSSAPEYAVYRAAHGLPFDRIVVVVRNEYLDWYVVPDVHYLYYVTALNADGESLPSDTVRFIFRPEPTAAYGVITGQVTDESTGTPLQGAVVRMVTRNGMWSETICTDTGGVYWAKLDTGKYLVRADQIGYVGEWYTSALHVDSA